VRIDRSSSVPIHMQIRRHFQELILSGVLSSGSRLPATRELAESLGVSRSTVVTAYRQLWSEGLVEGKQGGGTVVTDAPGTEDPIPGPGLPLMWERQYSQTVSRFDPEVEPLDDHPLHEGTIYLRPGNAPDSFAFIQRIREIFSDFSPQDLSSMRWGSAQGLPALREAVSERLLRDGTDVAPSQIIVTASGQQAVYLLIRSFVQPGDFVACEMPTYLGAQYALDLCDARVCAIPVDEDGMRLDILEGILRRHHPKLIFATPSFQNPTGATMPLARRKELLRLAYDHRVPILEYNRLSPFRFEGRSIPSLLALDTREHVLHVDESPTITLPGIRIAWLIVPPRVRRRLVPTKWTIDADQGAMAQWMAARLIGELDERISALCTRFRQRRDAMDRALHRYCEGLLRWTLPDGGFYFWADLLDGVHAETVERNAYKHDLAVISGTQLFHRGPGGERNLRLDFNELSEEKIEEGIRRLALAIRESRHNPPSV